MFRRVGTLQESPLSLFQVQPHFCVYSVMRNLFLILFSTLVISANAAVVHGGRLWSECNNGVVVVHSELLIAGFPQAVDSLFIDWGDGVEQVGTLASFTLCDTGNGTCTVRHDLTHAYSPGTFYVTLQIASRVAGIANMLNSGASTFMLQAEVVVDPNLVTNEAPHSLLPLFEAEMSSLQNNTITLNVTDADGDSIVWEMQPCLYATNYVDPDVAGGGTFLFDQTQQNYSWNPQVTGAYSVLFFFREWRQVTPGNWVMIGYSSQEILLDVNNAVGVEENSGTTFLNVYPNPATNEIHFAASNTTATTLEIIDAVGRVVLLKSLEPTSYEHTVDVSMLPAGVYAVRVGEVVERVVVE